MVFPPGELGNQAGGLSGECHALLCVWSAAWDCTGLSSSEGCYCTSDNLWSKSDKLHLRWCKRWHWRRGTLKVSLLWLAFNPWFSPIKLDKCTQSTQVHWGGRMVKRRMTRSTKMKIDPFWVSKPRRWNVKHPPGKSQAIWFPIRNILYTWVRPLFGSKGSIRKQAEATQCIVSNDFFVTFWAFQPMRAKCKLRQNIFESTQTNGIDMWEIQDMWDCHGQYATGLMCFRVCC